MDRNVNTTRSTRSNPAIIPTVTDPEEILRATSASTAQTRSFETATLGAAVGANTRKMGTLTDTMSRLNRMFDDNSAHDDADAAEGPTEQRRIVDKEEEAAITRPAQPTESDEHVRTIRDESDVGQEEGNSGDRLPPTEDMLTTALSEFRTQFQSAIDGSRQKYEVFATSKMSEVKGRVYAELASTIPDICTKTVTDTVC